MARLPQVPRRGEVLRAPSSSAGPDTIASPFRVVAKIFGDLGDQAMDAAVDAAPMRGQNAVTRDAEGNLQFTPMSNLSAVGRAYNRAGISAYMARLNTDMGVSAGNIRRQANGNAETFNEAWGAYSDEILGKVPDVMRGGVSALLEDMGRTTSGGIMDARFNADMTEFGRSIEARRERLQFDLETAFAAGAGNTPEAQRMLAEYRDLGQELAENPNFTLSQEEVDLQNDRFQADLIIEQVRGDTARRFATSPNEARAYAEQIINDPNLALSAAERRQAIDSIMSTYTSATSEYRMAQAAYRAGTDGLLEALKDRSLPFDPAEYEAAIAEGQRVGDTGRVYELQRWNRWRTWTNGFAALDPAGQVAQFERDAALAGGAAPPEAVAYLDARAPGLDWAGLSGDMAVRITAAAQDWEALTGGRASFASARRSSERQAQLYANYLLTTGQGDSYTYNGVVYRGDPSEPVGLAAPPGSSRHESGDAVDINSGPFLEWLHANAGAYGLEFLTGDAFRDDPGHVQLAGGARPGTEMVPPDVLTEEQDIMAENLGVMLTQYEFQVGEGFGIDEESATILVDFARSVNDPGQTARVEKLIMEAVAAGGVRTLSPLAQEQMLAELRSDLAGIPYMSAVASASATQAAETERRLMDEDPYQVGITRELYDPVAIDFTTPAAMASTLQTRQQQLSMLSDVMGQPVRSLLRPAEAEVMATAWENADVQQRQAMAASFAGAIADPTMLRATLAQFAEDSPVMAVAGALSAVNPQGAAYIINGQAALEADPSLAPKENDTAEIAGWTSVANQVLPSSMFSPALIGTRGNLIEAMRFAYVGLAVEARLPAGAPVSEDLAEQAAAIVTGGTVEFNGQEIIAPIYGMAQEDFDRLTRGAIVTPGPDYRLGDRLDVTPPTPAALMANARTGDGDRIAWEDVIGNPSQVHLEGVGDGRYHIRFGEGSTATYAQDINGGTFVLNLAVAAVAPLGRSIADRMGVRFGNRGGDASPAPSSPTAPVQAGMTDLYATQGRNYQRSTGTAAPAPAGLGIDVAGIVAQMERVGAPDIVRFATAGRLGGISAMRVMANQPQFPMPEEWKTQLWENALFARRARANQFAATGLDVGRIVNGMPQFQMPFERRIDAVLDSRQAVTVDPTSPLFQEAVDVFERSPALGPDTLNRENFYAMMLMSGLPRGQLLVMLAERWGTSVMMLNQTLGLEGL